MSYDIAIGATLTGGTVVTLIPAGIAPGKSTFVTPDHTRLTPETIEFTMAPGAPLNGDPGVARSGLKISFASREAEEGCCTVKAGAVIVDTSFRWNLNQTVTSAQDAIAYFRAVVNSDEFEDSMIKGVLPTGS